MRADRISQSAEHVVDQSHGETGPGKDRLKHQQHDEQQNQRPQYFVSDDAIDAFAEVWLVITYSFDSFGNDSLDASIALDQFRLFIPLAFCERGCG